MFRSIEFYSYLLKNEKIKKLLKKNLWKMIAKEKMVANDLLKWF